MSEQQRRLEKERYYAALAEKARLSMTYVTPRSPHQEASPNRDTAAMSSYGASKDGYTTTSISHGLQQPQPHTHQMYTVNANAVQGYPAQGYPVPQQGSRPMGQATDQHGLAGGPSQAEDRWDPEPAVHINRLLEDVEKLNKEKDQATEDAKRWNQLSQNTSKQQSALARDKSVLETKVRSLERQLKEEQTAKQALKRRLEEHRPDPLGRSSLTETLDLKESELLNLQGKMKELRFHNSALRSQIEELRQERGPQTDLELAREVQHLKSEVERLSTQNEILEKQLTNQELRKHELWTLQEGASGMDKDDPYALLGTAFKCKQA